QTGLHAQGGPRRHHRRGFVTRGGLSRRRGAAWNRAPFCGTGIVTKNAPTVTEVGVLARRMLRGPRRGHIAAVFERSLYAVFGDEWICIGQRSIGSGAMH